MRLEGSTRRVASRTSHPQHLVAADGRGDASIRGAYRDSALLETVLLEYQLPRRLTLRSAGSRMGIVGAFAYASGRHPLAHNPSSSRAEFAARRVADGSVMR